MKTYRTQIRIRQDRERPVLDVNFVRGAYPVEHAKLTIPIVRESETFYWLDFPNAYADGVSDFDEICEVRPRQAALLADLERACQETISYAFSHREMFGRKQKISFKSEAGISNSQRAPGTKRVKSGAFRSSSKAVIG